jgi:alpha/beta superfamily hydrolase
MPEQAVFFDAGDVRLQGMYYPVDSPIAGAVVCHPHPLYGGTMDNNVVVTVAETLRASGHSTLRFNFRGVGRSEGTYGGGVAEVEDVRAAIAFMREYADTLVLAGYSFGSWVAASALAGDNSVSHLLLVAPPTSMFDFSTLMQDDTERARHVIVGDRDQFCDRDALQDVFDRLPEPKSIQVIKNADHFWFGRERTLTEAVDEAMSDHI